METQRAYLQNLEDVQPSPLFAYLLPSWSNCLQLASCQGRLHAATAFVLIPAATTEANEVRQMKLA